MGARFFFLFFSFLFFFFSFFELFLSPSLKKTNKTFPLPSQEHFYFEPNAVICTPVDSEMIVESSTQNLNKTQKFVSSVLGIDSNKVQASVRRLGGGFGGKETQTIPFASAAAVAAHHEKRPVRLVVPRNQVIFFCFFFSFIFLSFYRS